MSAFIASLNSGSNGNCYYIGNHTEAVLIDAGISCRETEKRMRNLGLRMDKVKAVFISHEHIDHIKGVEVLAKKHNLPVYITAVTLGNTHMRPAPHFVRNFIAHEAVTIGSLKVTGFPKWHDAADPYSFVIDTGDIRIGVFTDIGAPCEHVIAYFSGCHAAFLETNYDEQMLENGRYPYHLKKRISGDHGHLSNTQAVELFNNYRPSFMTHLLLSHLSKDNNHPDVALAAFAPHSGNVAVSVASRYNETEVFHITGTTAPTSRKAVQAVLF